MDSALNIDWYYIMDGESLLPIIMLWEHNVDESVSQSDLQRFSLAVNGHIN